MTLLCVMLGLIKVWDEILGSYTRERLGERTLYEINFCPLKIKRTGRLKEKEDFLKNEKINSYYDRKYC